MKTRLIVSLLSAALIAPAAGLISGCDREVAHEEKTVRNADGTGKHEETTVKEKSDGTVVKESEKKVDNTPGR